MGTFHKVIPAMEVDDEAGRDGGEKRALENRLDRTPCLVKERTFAEREEQIVALYDEYRPRLYRYIRSMNLGRDQAEEIIQEIFLRLAAELQRKGGLENPQGWIVRVAHNFAVDVLKKNGRDGIGASVRLLGPQDRVDPALSPEEMYLKKERIRRIEIALERFPLRQRLCFQMRVQGFRHKDIGLALDISEPRVVFILRQVALRLAAICG